MDVLILGGTRFLGPHLTDALLRRGHAVTQFNRGATPWAAPDGVRIVHGDRTTDLDRPQLQYRPATRWSARAASSASFRNA